MSAAGLDEQRLSELLAAYGADAARWPEEEAGALAGHPDLKSKIAKERALDEMLNAFKVEAPDAALSARILAARPGREVRHGTGVWRALMSALWPEGPVWVPMGTCAAALLFGLYIGASGALTAMSSDPQTETALLSLAMADSVLEENWDE